MLSGYRPALPLPFQAHSVGRRLESSDALFTTTTFAGANARAALLEWICARLWLPIAVLFWVWLVFWSDGAGLLLRNALM